MVHRSPTWWTPTHVSGRSSRQSLDIPTGGSRYAACEHYTFTNTARVSTRYGVQSRSYGRLVANKRGIFHYAIQALAHLLIAASNSLRPQTGKRTSGDRGLEVTACSSRIRARAIRLRQFARCVCASRRWMRNGAAIWLLGLTVRDGICAWNRVGPE